ncbi:hypothetical protein BG61_07875 [Caballeronia glathei]|uniref:Uncharacterized protein n=1 Tax=Caballeronia glathei TaxID=60547 RepID=A0A069PBA5_9BURK|nr:hypothetical protein BG61_07875 [Caballeronia glathei]
MCGVPDEATGTDQLIVIAETRETASDALARIRGSINEAALAIFGAPPEQIALVPPRSNGPDCWLTALFRCAAAPGPARSNSPTVAHAGYCWQ